VFIHLVGNYKIFQLSEAQIQRYANSVLSEPSQDQDVSQGLRFKAEKYARRIDPYDAMSCTSTVTGTNGRCPKSDRSSVLFVGRIFQDMLRLWKILSDGVEISNHSKVCQARWRRMRG